MTNEESAWFLTTLLNIVRDNSVKTINVKKTPRFEESIEKAIDALTEPKTGEWVEVEDYNGDIHYQCDQCKGEFILIDGTPEDNNYWYCPNCGADMRGDNNGLVCVYDD